MEKADAIRVNQRGRESEKGKETDVKESSTGGNSQRILLYLPNLAFSYYFYINNT